MVYFPAHRVDLLLHDPLVGQQPGIVRLKAHVLVERRGVSLGQEIDGLLQLCQKVVVPLPPGREPRHDGAEEPAGKGEHQDVFQSFEEVHFRLFIE